MNKKISSKRRKVIIGCTSSEYSPAAQVIGNNVDLLTQILLLVPVKSLIKFKCVSKCWLFLISDSQFALNYTRRNPRSLISGLYLYCYPRSRMEQVKSVSLHGHSSLPTLAFLNGVGGDFESRIKSSCNGLLLCMNDRVVCNHNRTTYIVCNLTTQKFTVLPEPGGHSSKLLPAYLAFDPSKSPHYKVVLVRYSNKIDFYSSESASWKQIVVSEPPGRRLGGVFWNGAIHWLNDKNVHVRFDVDAEKLIEMPNPPEPKILSLEKIRYFGECGGHLLLIQSTLYSAVGFIILDMDRDSCCWIVKCRVSLKPLISAFPEIFYRTRDCTINFLSVVKGAKENDFVMVFGIPDKVISYNLKCKTWKVLLDLPPGDFKEQTSHIYVHCYQFIESLSPV